MILNTYTLSIFRRYGYLVLLTTNPLHIIRQLEANTFIRIGQSQWAGALLQPRLYPFRFLQSIISIKRRPMESAM